MKLGNHGDVKSFLCLSYLWMHESKFLVFKYRWDIQWRILLILANYGIVNSLVLLNKPNSLSVCRVTTFAHILLKIKNYELWIPVTYYGLKRRGSFQIKNCEQFGKSLCYMLSNKTLLISEGNDTDEDEIE